MYNFNYHCPRFVEEAVAIRTATPEAGYLAGGQTLLPAIKLGLAAPSDLIDLGSIDELRGITTKAEAVVVGAMTPHDEVAAEGRAIPALAHLATGIGDAQVRNRGTIGGSIANNDPAADYPAALLGLAALVQTNRRSIAADDFFTGMFETALEEGEIVTSVSFPKPEAAAYAKFVNPASRFALVGVMVAKTANGVRVAVTGAGPCVFRVTEMEEALFSKFSPNAIEGIRVPDSDLNNDLHASAEYRAHLINVLARRAVWAAT